MNANYCLSLCESDSGLEPDGTERRMKGEIKGEPGRYIGRERDIVLLITVTRLGTFQYALV